MRLVQEAVRLFAGQILPQGGTYPLRTEFPVGGEIYNTIRLIFHNSVAAGGTDPVNPVVRGGYNLVRNLIFRSARGEEFVVCPGMGMHRLNWMLNGVEPVYDNIAAPGIDATGVYDTIIDLPFSHRMLARKEDLAVHTARYSHVELDITLGSIADLYTTPGATAVLTTTLDVILFRNKSGLYASGEPLAAPYIKHYPQYELARGYLDVESAYDLTMLGFIAFVQDMAPTNCYVPAVAVPYSGVPADVVNYFTFRDNLQRYVDYKTMDSFREERAQYGTIDHADMAEGVGVYPYFFAREGSIYNGYWTGEKSEIRLENDPITLGTPTTPQVDSLFFGLRTLRD